MWLLVVLCAAVSCEADLIAVHRADTEESCRAYQATVHDEYGATSMCVRDVTLYDPLYEEFE